MPLLTWPTKSPPNPIPAHLSLDSLVYPGGAGWDNSIFSNRLILGDNFETASALLPEYEGRIDLIYTDPPFFTNRRYPARVGRGEDSRRPQEWQMAEGYADAWSNLDEYLDMLYPRLALMHRLLSPTGTFYLHLDWHANSYARLLLDEIFGSERLLNEIIWVYHGPSPIRSAFNRKHDTILVYTKSERYTFNVDAVRQPYNPVTVKTFNSSPKAGFGKVPDLERGKVPEDWWYFPVVARMHNERTGYPTQKPAALLERIILASTNPGDIVADLFCGSGTSAVTAAGLGRSFLAADASWRAVHTARTRLVSMDNAQPFMFQRSSHGDATAPPAAPTRPLHTGLTRRGGFVEVSVEAASDLDYWEVDPAWDGHLFHSRLQAFRPLRRGSIPLRLSLPANSNRLAVRLVLANGDHYFWAED